MQTPVSPDTLVDLAGRLEARRSELKDILCRIATWRAAELEIDHALATLRGAPSEFSQNPTRSISSMAVYLPSNVILLSYVLYAMIPTAYAEIVYVRPSLRGREVAYCIHELVSETLDLPITLDVGYSRKEFLRDRVLHSEVTVFTGRCSNAEEVAELVGDDRLFLYFGSGVNPIVVGKHADIERASDDIVSLRTLNSGQDCLGPDLILVHHERRDELLDHLVRAIGSLRYGPLCETSADYSDLVYPNVAEDCRDFVHAQHDHIIYGGEINVIDRHVEPTLLYREIDRIEGYRDYPEFFAPIFNVVGYSLDDQIRELLGSAEYRHHAMGVSAYGVARDLLAFLQSGHVVTVDSTLESVNYGNMPFGGYGHCSGYVKAFGQLDSRPILASKEVHHWLEQKRLARGLRA